MKRIISISIIVLCLCLVTGCSTNKHITNISYSKFEAMLNNKETFAIEIYQTGCGYCEALEPKLNRVLKEYDINIYGLNRSKMTTEEAKKFRNIFGSVPTPTIIFIENGEEKGILYRLIGDQSEKQIINKFKSNGYIE